MKATRLIALALVAEIAMGCASIAQDTPSSPVNPATEGAGSSAQHVEAAGGAVEVDVQASGSMSASPGTGGGEGQAGVSVNGVGVGTGGQAGTSPSNGPGDQEPGAGQPGGGPAAGGPGDAGGTVPGVGLPGSAGRGDALACTALDLDAIEPPTAERILDVERDDGITVVPVCDGASVLTAAQLAALEENSAITAALSAQGYGPEQVIALDVPADAPVAVYVLGEGSSSVSFLTK